MERIRIGNDIQVKFTVYRNGEAESFIDATGIQVIVRNEAYNEIIPNTYSISQNIVTINLDAINLTKCGKCRVILAYHKGGDFAVDSLAFELVEFSSGENGTVAIDAVISVAKDGKSAYEVWRAYPGNEEKTEEDYFEWLQKPSIDASIVAMSAAGFANEKANLANEKSILANNAAVNADLKAVLANSAASNADAKATLANAAANAANNAAVVANTSASSANNAALSAGTTTSVYNVTVAIPLSAGVYYTKSTARDVVPVVSRKLGLVITYSTADKVWYSEKYIGSTVAGWTTESNWEQVPDAALLAQVRADLNKVETDLNEKIGTIYNGKSNINQINNIGSFIPSIRFLQNANENPVNGGFPKIENVADTESPFKNILGYLTRFTNTQTINQSNFKYESVEVRDNRPALISIGFWVKKSQLTGISFRCQLFFASYTHIPIVLIQNDILLSSLVDGDIGVKIINNITSGLFNSTREMYKAYEIGDWCQIVANYKSIVWNVDSSTKWKYGLGFQEQQTKWINKSLDFVNFQISEDKEIPSGVFVIQDILGSMDTYPLSINILNNNVEKNTEDIIKLESEIQSISNKTNKFVFNNAENSVSYIQSNFNDTYDFRFSFIAKRSYSLSGNACFNLHSASLINKTTLSETLIHSASDDITPGNYNGTYIGANHGCADLKAVTANNHGKTFADIGSEWSNGTYKFYIIGIVDLNTLLILGENYKTYPKWGFRVLSIGDTLTHVSGATNTSNIIVSNSVTNQLWPSISVSNLKVILDGVEIIDNGTYHFNELNICENYDVFNVASTLDKIKDLVGTLNANPVYNQLNADKVVRHSINYKFTSADKCFINTNFIAYQDLDIGYFGFIQQGALSGSNVKMYIPKSLPIMDGAAQKDFRTIIDYNSVNNTMNFTSEFWENPLLPPDRYIQSSENIAFNAGFLFDYGVGGNKRKDFINNSFFLYPSRKTYPRGIDNKTVVTGGSKYSAVCFRIYSDINRFNKNGVINENSFEYEGNLYVYADFNNAGYYELSIPDKYVGKLINIFEKSNNVAVLSETTNSKILVKVENSAPMYGYLVMKI